MMNENWRNVTQHFIQSPPQWMFDLIEFRKNIVVEYIEPHFVWLGQSFKFGEELRLSGRLPAGLTTVRHGRQLGILPSYVTDVDVNSFKMDTSLSFATLIMLIVTMFMVFLIFLSCFYHNQKTSPLFISPRRHRLPKLVPVSYTHLTLPTNYSV